MDSLRQYFLRIIVLCILAAVIDQLSLGDKYKGILRFLCGLLILLVVIGPICDFEPETILRHWEGFEFAVQDNNNYEEIYQQQLRDHIQHTAEKYIEDKAASIGTYIQAVVEISDDEYPVPVSVEIIGTMTANQWKILSDYMHNSLGIHPEYQRWRDYYEHKEIP